MFSKSLIIFTAFSLDAIQLALDYVMPQTRCWAISNTEWSRQVISCLFFTHPKTALISRGRDGETLFLVWLPQPQVHDPLLSQMRCPAHTDQAQEELRWGSSPPALTMELQGHQLQGRSRSRQGREGKAARSAEHWQPSSQGTGEQDMLQAGFLWWSGNQLWFLTPYSTKPGQTASSTAQL